MKNILLLGGFGFIGSNLMHYIDNRLNEEFKVVVFDRMPVHPFNLKFNCVKKVYSGDFSDNQILKNILKENKFDYIIHSLSTTIPANSGNIRFDIESNLIPTVELLDLLIECESKNIIYISSGGAIYGQQNHNRKHCETDDTFPISSYGIVKLAIEKYMFQYARLYGVNPLVIRLSNPYGRYHYSGRQGIVNVAIDHALANRKFTVWGNGEARKDYIFIDDFSEILFRLLNQNISNRILNIASGQILSVNRILDEIKQRFPKFEWDYSDSNIFDIQNFELDNTEVHRLIGDYSYTSFEEGIEKTIDWKKS